MKLISFGYDEDFNLLLQFPSFTDPYTQKPLALYQLTIVSVPIKEYNTGINTYTWLQPRKDYLSNYIPLTTVEVSACKHIGHQYFCK